MKTIIGLAALAFFAMPSIPAWALAIPGNFPISAISEPATMVFLGSILIALGSYGRKRCKACRLD